MIGYAVIDTNVLVSALLSSHADAATVLVVDKIFTRELVPVYSDAILAEYGNVLRRKKFHFSEQQIALLLDAIQKSGIRIDPESVEEQLPDPGDLPFYEVFCDRKGEACLVTGNLKHFPQHPLIMTARQFLEFLEKADRSQCR